MKILGIDFGLKRLGLASSEGILAAPLKTIKVKGFKDAVDQVAAVIERENFDKIVVGLPEGKIGQTVVGFVSALRKLGFDVDTADETLSSQQAKLQMIKLDIPKEKRQINDAYSAAIILQDWLDQR